MVCVGRGEGGAVWCVGRVGLCGVCGEGRAVWCVWGGGGWDCVVCVERGGWGCVVCVGRGDGVRGGGGDVWGW